MTGIVLARELSQEAFGLVGALLVFQSFALLFIDSGFSFALLQRKQPSNIDYSSVFWFNFGVATLLYIILWLIAPWISSLFGSEDELIPLSRVMFLTFIINSLAIVQTNRLMKQMNVRPIAIANFLSLALGGVVGIVLAVEGWGPWAIVWQAITLNSVKAFMLWGYCRWLPEFKCSWLSLKNFMRVGLGMMGTSFLNVLFQNIYSFFIGNRAGLVPLGYYTQADKWSKMGVTSLTQIITATFLPALSEVQNDRTQHKRIVSRINRFTSMLLIPGVAALIVMAPTIFHLLFGTKWDASIVLFQLLLFRGVFTTYNTLYNNFMLSLGNSKSIFRLELMRDVIAIAGIFITLPYIALSSPDNAVEGLCIFMIGQIIASFITWIVTLHITSKVTGVSTKNYLLDSIPGLAIGALISIVLIIISLTKLGVASTFITQGAVCAITALLIFLYIKRKS